MVSRPGPLCSIRSRASRESVEHSRASTHRCSFTCGPVCLDKPRASTPSAVRIGPFTARSFGNARRAEVIGDAADRDHQRVVADAPRRGDLTPFVVEHGGEAHELGRTIEPDHLAEAVTETVPVRLGQ
jgi:hypothetical protein